MRRDELEYCLACRVKWSEWLPESEAAAADELTAACTTIHTWSSYLENCALSTRMTVKSIVGQCMVDYLFPTTGCSARSAALLAACSAASTSSPALEALQPLDSTEASHTPMETPTDTATLVPYATDVIHSVESDLTDWDSARVPDIVRARAIPAASTVVVPDESIDGRYHAYVDTEAKRIKSLSMYLERVVTQLRAYTEAHPYIDCGGAHCTEDGTPTDMEGISQCIKDGIYARQDGLFLKHFEAVFDQPKFPVEPTTTLTPEQIEADGQQKLHALRSRVTQLYNTVPLMHVSPNTHESLAQPLDLTPATAEAHVDQVDEGGDWTPREAFWRKDMLTQRMMHLAEMKRNIGEVLSHIYC